MEQQDKPKNLWEDVVDPVTGNHSLTENIVPKTVWESCKPEDHVWEETEFPRQLACKKCGMMTRYVLGIDILVDGKLRRIG